MAVGHETDPFCALPQVAFLLSVIGMASVATADFIVWGVDQTPYGPVELPTLVSWIKDERVTADTWLFVGKTGDWQKAAQVPELQMFFR